MTTVKALITNCPVVSYFTLTFAISWGGVLMVSSGPDGMTGVRAQDSPLFLLAVLAMVAGPSVTGLLLTAVIDGRHGLRKLWSRLLTWRVGTRWYAVALITAPLLSMATSSMLSLGSPRFLPGILVSDDKLAILLLGLGSGMTAGFFEELGWTGFAIPRLTARYGVIQTGLIVGLLWSAWHLLVIVWGIGDRAGQVPLPVFLIVDGVAGLPMFRVLMVWVYTRTESLLIGMLMHFSLTASTLILTPLTIGAPLLAYGLVFASMGWLVIAAIAMTTRTLLRPRRFQSAM